MNDRVVVGSLEHVSPILLAIIIGTFSIAYSKKKLNKKQQTKFLHGFGLFVSLTVLVFHLYQISLGNYNFKTDLPLFLCSFLALIIPLFTYYMKYWMHEVLLFWIIAGTSQGVLTPDIAEGFPSFDYFRYWIVHLGLILIICYSTSVFNMKPKLKSVFKSFFALQIYMIILLGINYVLDANYSYLNRKPESASVLDYLGEWPYYILIIEVILLPLFFLIYLPFYVTRK